MSFQLRGRRLQEKMRRGRYCEDLGLLLLLSCGQGREASQGLSGTRGGSRGGHNREISGGDNLRGKR